MTILDKMRQKDNFTETEHTIIEYLLKHQDTFLCLTINELAKITFSSNATVIRMCHKLGFEGYKDFKIALLKELESHKYVVNSIDYSTPFQVEESTDTIVNSIFSLYKDSINLIQSQLDISSLERIVTCLIQSQRIFVFGIGDAKITAMNFINKLIKINYFPILATENNEEENICHNMTQHDCALFITYGGKYQSYNTCVKTLIMKGTPIIVLTANEESVLVKRSTYHLCLPDRENNEKIATFYSQFGFLYLLSLIYSLIYNDYKLRIHD